MMGILNVVKWFSFEPWNPNFFLSDYLILDIIIMESFGIYTAEISSNVLIC